MSILDNSVSAQLERERALNLKLRLALEQVAAIAKEERALCLSSAEPLSSYVFLARIDTVLDSLEVKT